MIDIREQVAKRLYWNWHPEITDKEKVWQQKSLEKKKCWLEEADQILSLSPLAELLAKLKATETVCPECKGKGGFRGIRWDEKVNTKCPKCKGSGSVVNLNRVEL